MPFKTVSSSSDNLLTSDSTPVLRSSLSNFELNSSSGDKSLDYYNFCAPKLPAHSTGQNKTLSLQGGLTLSSVHKTLHSEKSRSLDVDSELLSPVTQLPTLRDQVMSMSDSDILAPTYESIADFNQVEGKLQQRSSSCDCLHDSTENLLSDKRPESQNALYDKLIPQHTDASIYDSLGPSREDLQTSPDPAESLPLGIGIGRMSYYRMTHNYEDVDVELRHSDKSGSASPEDPSDWTSSLPLSVIHKDSRPKSMNLKETNTLSRKKQLPLQEEWFSAETSKFRPPRLSREGSIDRQGKHVAPSVNPNLKFQPRSSVDSMDVLSSTDSASVAKRESNGSASSAELETKSVSQIVLDHMKREHSNSPIHRVTHEEVEIRMKHMHTDKPLSQPVAEPPAIPKRGLSEVSLISQPEAEIEEANRLRDISPPIPPRPQERFTVPLPQTQFEFVKPPPPPRPKVLCPTELSYATVTFANGDTSLHVEPVMNNQRPFLTISQASSDVAYVAVHHGMTEGLRATSEQVADHHREFFETKQQS